MRPMEAAANLTDLETYLFGCHKSAAPASKAKKQFADWIRAVGKARAFIIRHVTIDELLDEQLDRLEEDDGK